MKKMCFLFCEQAYFKCSCYDRKNNQCSYSQPKNKNKEGNMGKLNKLVCNYRKLYDLQMDINVWYLLVQLWLRFPVNQEYFSNNSEQERGSMAEDESKMTGKEGLGSGPLGLFYCYYTVVSLFMVPSCGHTKKMLVFFMYLLMQSSSM